MQETLPAQLLGAVHVAPTLLPGLLEAGIGPHGRNDPLLAPDPPPYAALDDQTASLAELTRQALAYAGALGLTPLPGPRLQGVDLRYVTGPLIVFEPSWGADVPDWLRVTIRPARLGLVLAGERECASEEEAVIYLMTAGLAQPLTHDWAEAYLWLGAQVLARWSRLPDAIGFWTAVGMEAPSGLNRTQAADLENLRLWLRRRASTARTGRR